jgi:hypothetical protein
LVLQLANKSKLKKLNIILMIILELQIYALVLTNQKVQEQAEKI